MDSILGPSVSLLDASQFVCSNLLKLDQSEDFAIDGDQRELPSCSGIPMQQSNIPKHAPYFALRFLPYPRAALLSSAVGRFPLSLGAEAQPNLPKRPN